MHTILQRQVLLKDAVYKIAEIVRAADETITHVEIETSDQGEYLTCSGVRWANFSSADLEDALDGDDAVSVEDWASSLSWDDARDSVPGWVTLNAKGGYFEIDVDAALKAQAPVEIKPVDLVTGVLALHTLRLEIGAEFPYACSCAVRAADAPAYRQHVAEQIVEVLS